MIEIKDYDPIWAKTFLELKSIYKTHLKSYILSVEHVGSTSVIGLAAKPILDIDIVIDPMQDLAPIIKILDDLGYKHLGDLGIEKREAFRSKNEYAPYSTSKQQWQRHNLYVCPLGCLSLENHLKFRDYLRKNTKDAIAYANLKRDLAKQYPHNGDLYCEAKTNFITNILSKTGIDNQAIKNITNQNKVEK